MDIISNYHYFKALRRGEATKGVRTDGKEERERTVIREHRPRSERPVGPVLLMRCSCLWKSHTEVVGSEGLCISLFLLDGLAQRKYRKNWKECAKTSAVGL